MMIIWQTLEASTELTWLLATAAESLINMRDISNLCAQTIWIIITIHAQLSTLSL